MTRRSPLRRLALLALSASLLAWGAPPALATADPDDYPTWADVEAARGSEAASQAEYERLEDALTRARAESERAAEQFSEATRSATRAAADLEEASDREIALTRRAEQAETDLSESSEAFGRVVSWLYVNGTGLASTSELAASAEPEEFMAKLSTMTQVSESWNTIAEDAAAELNTVASLQQQADDAASERARLADEAAAAAADAQAAQADADAAVQTALGRTDTVYEQLASLKGTTAETERRYQIGKEIEEQLRQDPPSGGEAPGGGGGGGEQPIGGGGGGVVVDPAGAQAYARSQLGAYGWGGDQFSCLVSLWNGESNWRADALNPYSGAYGIPQSLPAEKMLTAGPDWRTNGHTQVDWGLGYIQAAYGSPCAAWNSWQSRNPHWY